jgi:hypothetical protein
MAGSPSRSAAFFGKLAVMAGGGIPASCLATVKTSLTKEISMKKSLVAAAIVALALTACGKKEEPAKPAPAPAPAAAPAPAPAAAPADAAKPADAGAPAPAAAPAAMPAAAPAAAPAPAPAAPKKDEKK